MSLCSSSDGPFQNNFFKDSLPTPGLDNNCDYFIVEKDDDIDPFVAMKDLDEIDCDPNIESADELIEAIEARGMVVEREVEISMNDEDYHNCPLKSADVKRDMGETERFIDDTIDRIEKLFPYWDNNDHDYSKKKWTERFLTHDDVLFMRYNLDELLPVREMDVDYFWVELLKNLTHPLSSRYR